ncbi:MAG: hypothetical protein HZA14_05085 [Nitrospirae bacterium]|nr:hypothetical protein [Nitrospirota bacterium]
MKKDNNFLPPPLVTAFAAFSIILIAFLSYRNILDYFFTTADSLALIETNRILSINDPVRIFTEPMMGGTEFIELAKHYRPVQGLSFSLDYFIWKLKPFGYHLTDLVLHVSVSVSVFFLMRLLTNGKQLHAWLSSVLFAVHPVLIEIVPGIARRQDIIATLFMLLSLLSFLKRLHSSSGPKTLLYISMFFYLAALGSKEIAVILLPLIFSYLMIFSGRQSIKEKLFHSIKKCLPYLLLTFAYLLWRAYILQGIGGRFGLSGKPLEISSVVFSVVRVISLYISDLLFPLDYVMLNLLSSRSISLFVMFPIVSLLLYYRRTILEITLSGRGITRFFKILLIAVMILSLTGMLTSLFMPQHVYRLLSAASFGEKLKLLTSLMEKRYYVLPSEFHKEDFILRLLCFALASSSAAGLIIIQQGDKVKNYFTDSANGGLIGYLLLWLFFPLCVYMPTLMFSHHFMYISVIPFSACLAVFFIEGFQSVIRRARKKEVIGVKRLFSFIMITGLLISLFSYSPLVRKYRDWETASNLYSMFFGKLSEIIPQLPHDAAVNVYDLPRIIVYSKDFAPRAQTATFLTDYSIKSWLNLNYPNNGVEVSAINRGGIYTNISELKIETGKNNKAVNIIVSGERIDGDRD